MKTIAFCFALVASLFWTGICIGQNNDWPKAIKLVSKAAQEYGDHVEAKTESRLWGLPAAPIGDVERHKCAILGRMLGKLDEIREIEKLEYPKIGPDSDLVELAYFSVELDTWVNEAQKALAANESDRINQWNLDCVGTQGIPASARIGNDAPEAQFAFDQDNKFLRVLGDIDSGFHDRFMAELALHPDVTTVELGSAGGSVKDAMLAGREIRKRGLDTVLFGNCYSACPLVFVGGRSRTLWSYVRHDFGFHRLSTRDGTALPDDDPIYDLIGDYLTEMGVKKSTYLRWMKSAAPKELFKPEPKVLCDPNLATFVQRICADGKRF